MLLLTAAVNSFLLNNIPLHAYTIIHILGCWRTLGLFFIFGHYKQRCWYISVYTSPGVHVPWLLLDCSSRQPVACNFNCNRKLLSKVAALTSMITNSVWVLPLLRAFASAWCLSLIPAFG